MGTIEEYLMAKMGKRDFGKLMDGIARVTVKPRKRRGRGKRRG